MVRFRSIPLVPVSLIRILPPPPPGDCVRRGGLGAKRLWRPHKIGRPMVREPLEDSTVGIGLAVSAALAEVYEEGPAIGSEVTDAPEAYGSPASIVDRECHQRGVQGDNASR